MALSYKDEASVTWPEMLPHWYKERFDFRAVLRTRQVVARTPEQEKQVQDHVDALVASMGTIGQTHPIFVKRYADCDRVHPGVSRMAAAHELGWTWLWAYVSPRTGKGT